MPPSQRNGPPAYRFVHLQLHVGLEAEEFVRPGGGELFGAVCEEEEIAEEESPQLPAALGFVNPAAVQQLARPEAVRQRVEDQVLEDRSPRLVLVRKVPRVHCSSSAVLVRPHLDGPLTLHVSLQPLQPVRVLLLSDPLVDLGAQLLGPLQSLSQGALVCVTVWSVLQDLTRSCRNGFKRALEGNISLSLTFFMMRG